MPELSGYGPDRQKEYKASVVPMADGTYALKVSGSFSGEPAFGLLFKAAQDGQGFDQDDMIAFIYIGGEIRWQNLSRGSQLTQVPGPNDLLQYGQQQIAVDLEMPEFPKFPEHIQFNSDEKLKIDFSEVLTVLENLEFELPVTYPVSIWQAIRAGDGYSVGDYIAHEREAATLFWTNLTQKTIINQPNDTDLVSINFPTVRQGEPANREIKGMPLLVPGETWEPVSKQYPLPVQDAPVLMARQADGPGLGYAEGDWLAARLDPITNQVSWWNYSKGLKLKQSPSFTTNWDQCIVAALDVLTAQNAIQMEQNQIPWQRSVGLVNELRNPPIIPAPGKGYVIEICFEAYQNWTSTPFWFSAKCGGTAKSHGYLKDQSVIWSANYTPPLRLEPGEGYWIQLGSPSQLGYTIQWRRVPIV
jgi:hypothetical protein